MSSLVLRGVEVGGALVDVRCETGRVAAVAPDLPHRRGDRIVEGRGGALIPGLHDHHIHLLATAAADRSLRVGPPAVTTVDGFAEALRRADAALPTGEWIRAVGYHESVAGEIDRDAIDRVVPSRPVRVQHRTGALWVLNGAACTQVGLDGDERPLGAEVDATGRATGRLLREDDWLRTRLPEGPAPDLVALGRRLAGYGVTGLTDATPFTDPDDVALLARAGLPQRLQVTGGIGLASLVPPPGAARGPVKLVIGDHDLPGLDTVARWLSEAHAADLPVAVHIVTRVALVLALAAWDEAGVRPGDRIEHASVVPPELIGVLADRGLTVVTQPNFVAERGDRYRVDVDPEDRPDLYRCGSLLRAGVAVGAGTDAPYGHADPWRAVAAAIDRRTESGVVLGDDERVAPRAALDLFLGPLDDPGGPPRAVVPGADADLVLLAARLDEVLRSPSAAAVVSTFVAGDPVEG